MDKAWVQALIEESAGVGVPLEPSSAELLGRYAELLLRWNAKVNLTRITDSAEVRIKHIVDALAGLPRVPANARTVLDLGSGAGVPGIPWLAGRPDLAVTMVDGVAKKIAFVKTALGTLGLKQGRAVHVHLAGRPESEGVASAEVVTSRAFTALGDFLELGRHYLAPGGSIVAMLGPREPEGEARRIAGERGFELVEVAHHALPMGLGQRTIVRAVPRGTGVGTPGDFTGPR